MGTAIVWLVNTVIDMVILLIIVRAVISWLVAFNIINTSNRFVYEVSRFLEAITDPVLRPFQRVVPRLGGIDISPIVAFLAIKFVQIVFNIAAAPTLRLLLG
ncbi:MAG: YggT family protein [Caulobacteraceae bacterium]|jgi:YggT family protein|nr:YggT family protein [Caulobacteraceae bacterium]